MLFHRKKAVRKERGQKAKVFLRALPLTLLALPGVLFLLTFNYAPMFGVVLAFKDFRYDKGIFGSEWVGFKNFEFFFTSESAWRVTRNTLTMNAIMIISVLTLSIALALMLFELTRRWVKLFQTVLFLPFFISWVVVGYAVYALLATDYGAINSLIVRSGGKAFSWYGTPAFWAFILPIVNVWKNAGYYTLLFYTGLLGIDATYYEAAAIDGATRWQQIKKITLPLLSPLIIMLALLAIGKIFFSDFGLFFFVTRDSTSLYSVTDVIDTYVYRALRKSGDVTMSAAASLYQSVVGFALIVLSNWIVKRVEPTNAIF